MLQDVRGVCSGKGTIYEADGSAAETDEKSAVELPGDGVFFTSQNTDTDLPAYEIFR